MSRPLNIIAEDIENSWPKVNYAARPYLDAMHELDGIDGNYYADTAQSMVLYFLSNATSFRGDDARRIKKELKSMAGIK